MDPSIQPKPSNHHKPRIRIGTFLGLWPKYYIIMPKYTAKMDPDGSVLIKPNGHVMAGETGSLDRAIEAAVEWKREHMPWVPA